MHGPLCISIIDDRNRYDIGGKTSAMPPGGKTSLQIEPRQATVERCYSLDAFATKTISVAAYQRDRSGGNVSTVRNCQKRPMKSRRATNGLLISRLTRNKQRSSEMGCPFAVMPFTGVAQAMGNFGIKYLAGILISPTYTCNFWGVDRIFLFSRYT